MPIVITWDDKVTPVTTYTVPDDVLSSLDRYRELVMPVNVNIQAAVVSIFMQYLVNPALNMFPTPEITTAKNAVQTANVSLLSAYAASVSIQVQLTITTSSLSTGVNGSVYSQTLSATGGSGTGYSWSLSSGSLPNGLSLRTNGILSGTPTVSGTFNFTVQVTDSSNNISTQSLSLIIS